jgi:magnesium-transporting ATPase (P-type)
MESQPIITAIYDSRVSSAIRDTAWIIPTIQSIHILAIAILIGSVLVTDLRLAGVLAVEESLQTVASRYMRWLWTALAVLLATGLVMVVGEPERTLLNPIYWWKMVLVLSATLMTLLFRLPLLRPEFKLEHAYWARASKPLAWLSLFIWTGVIFCGRWIAYAQ